MAQNTVDFSIDLSGDALLDDLLTDQAQNVLTSNSGTSRPTYAVAGTVWVDTTTTPWVWKMFDGTDDVTLGSLDLTANTFTPSAISIPASSITNGKLANVSQNTFKGRKDAAGTGSPQDMTASEARTAMSVYSIAQVDALVTTIKKLHLQDQKTTGTDGGTFTSGSFQTRTLNTEIRNNIVGASWASNQIVLPAGTYFVDATSPACGVIYHKTRLRNITDTVTLLVGSPEITWSSNITTSRSIIRGEFTLSGTKTLELQHQCDTTTSSTGFGKSAGYGEIEIYSDIQIWKIA